MRIIGGKDYYDHGLVHGIDESIVFRRQGRLIRGDIFPLPVRGGAPAVKPAPRSKAEFAGGSWNRSERDWEFEGLEHQLRGVYVFFCGKVYTGARLTIRDKKLGFYDGGGAKIASRETFWDQNSLGKRLAKCGVVMGEHRQSWLRQDHSRFTRPAFWRGEPEAEELNALLDLRVSIAVLTGEHTEKVPDPSPMHPKHTRSQVQWEVDGSSLKDVDFIKVVDPVQAFQQLSMWVGGVLPAPGNPMVQITDDKIKLAKRGFNKFSFRKEPTKKR